MRIRFIAILLCFLPTRLVRPIVNFLGAKIHRTAHVGLSWLEMPIVVLGPGCKIRHFNIIRVRRLVMHANSAVGNFNWLRGSFSISLSENAEIGARNVITRAVVASEIGPSNLVVGQWSKITAGHKLDLMRSISIGKYTVLAGTGSQLWTHGYVHELNQHGRYRVDGKISIGDDCYVGSSCIFNAGVRIGNGITIGGNSCISKDLLEQGLYVSQPLRYIPRNGDKVKDSLVPVSRAGLSERVFVKIRPDDQAK